MEKKVQHTRRQRGTARYNDALAAYGQGDLARAEELLLESLKDLPEDPASLRALDRVRQMMKRTRTTP